MEYKRSVFIICLFMTGLCFSQNAMFYEKESITISNSKTINFEEFKLIHDFFKNEKIFNWTEERHLKNNCEDRANAICILLDEWDIPNYKVWIFNGRILKKGKGTLKYGNYSWKYHVGAVIPVLKENQLEYYIIDPATTDGRYLKSNEWAENITGTPNSYYLFTEGNKYIFTKKKRRFNKSTFSNRNATNYTWTIEGIAGFNGLSRKHRKEMRTQWGQKKIQDTKATFEKLKKEKLSFL